MQSVWNHSLFEGEFSELSESSIGQVSVDIQVQDGKNGFPEIELSLDVVEEDIPASLVDNVLSMALWDIEMDRACNISLGLIPAPAA